MIAGFVWQLVSIAVRPAIPSKSAATLWILWMIWWSISVHDPQSKLMDIYIYIWWHLMQFPGEVGRVWQPAPLPCIAPHPPLAGGRRRPPQRPRAGGPAAELRPAAERGDGGGVLGRGGRVCDAGLAAGGWLAGEIGGDGKGRSRRLFSLIFWVGHCSSMIYCRFNEENDEQPRTTGFERVASLQLL